MNIDTILESLKDNRSNYFIDIGANEGPGPIFHLLQQPKSKGLCIEGGGGSMYEKLVNNLKCNPNINIHSGYITPLNSLELFEKYNVPISHDILKIDIDGYDLSILRVLLTKYKPKIIIAEINEKIPPPIYFEVKFDEKYSWDVSHFFGFSLQAGFDVLNPLNYSIIGLTSDGNNLIAINNDDFQFNISEQKSPEEIHKLFYADTKVHYFPYNKDVNHWLNIKDPEELKKDIFNYFTTERKMRGSKEFGVPISPDSFILSYKK